MSCQQTQPWGCRGTGLGGQILSAPWGSELEGLAAPGAGATVWETPRQSPQSHQLLCPARGSAGPAGPTAVLAGQRGS